MATFSMVMGIIALSLFVANVYGSVRARRKMVGPEPAAPHPSIPSWEEMVMSMVTHGDPDDALAAMERHREVARKVASPVAAVSAGVLVLLLSGAFLLATMQIDWAWIGVVGALAVLLGMLVDRTIRFERMNRLPEEVLAPFGFGVERRSPLRPQVIVGERRGRRITIDHRLPWSRTSVEAVVPEFWAAFTPQWPTGGQLRLSDGPDHVGAAIEALDAPGLWRHVIVAGAPNRLVVVRPRSRAGVRAWLYDLWLAEQLVRRLAIDLPARRGRA
jgi:hypothetical protein